MKPKTETRYRLEVRAFSMRNWVLFQTADTMKEAVANREKFNKTFWRHKTRLVKETTVVKREVVG